MSDYDEWKTAAPPDAAPEEPTLAQWVGGWDAEHLEQACRDYLDDCRREEGYTLKACIWQETTFIHAFAHWLSLFPDKYTPHNVLTNMGEDLRDSFLEFVQGSCAPQFRAFIITHSPDWLEPWYDDDMELAREEQA